MVPNPGRKILEEYWHGGGFEPWCYMKTEVTRIPGISTGPNTREFTRGSKSEVQGQPGYSGQTQNEHKIVLDSGRVGNSVGHESAEVVSLRKIRSPRSGANFRGLHIERQPYASQGTLPLNGFECLRER